MISKTLLVVFLLFYITISKVATDNISDDADLNFTEVAIKYGMMCEEYDATTEDGYILKLFHVPGNKTKPVLLMHGLMDTSDTFILRGHTSMVYLLSKAGYDVWVGNYRGNRYSRRHVTLNPDTDAAFWDFSMHEHGLYDLSTSIDVILNKTKASRLSLIGHSEGTVIMFILGSVRPEYNNKINVFIAWAPICYIHNIIDGIPPLISLANMLQTIANGLNINEFMRHNSFMTIMGRVVCARLPQLCIQLMYIFSGYNPDAVDPEFGLILLGHFPAGTSRKNLEHYYQIMLSRRFAHYDYGSVKNLVAYNSQKPPIYNLSKVTVNIAMFVGKNDKLSTLKDVRILKKQLPNVVFYRIFEKLNHIDFLVGRDAYKLIYPSVFKLLEKYT